MRTDGLTSMVQYAIGVFVFVYRLQNIISMVLLQMSFEKGLCWGIKLKATDFHQLKKYSGNTPPPMQPPFLKAAQMKNPKVPPLFTSHI